MRVPLSSATFQSSPLPAFHHPGAPLAPNAILRRVSVHSVLLPAALAWRLSVDRFPEIPLRSRRREILAAPQSPRPDIAASRATSRIFRSRTVTLPRLSPSRRRPDKPHSVRSNSGLALNPPGEFFRAQLLRLLFPHSL